MRLLESIHQVDLSAFTWFVRHKHRDTIVKVARIVSLSADGPLYVAAGALLLLTRQWEIALLLALGFLIERVCYKIFKGFFKRNRPPEAIPGFKSVVEPSDKFSFPSGHTSAAFLVACTFTYFFPIAGMLLFPWALCVGTARVVLGVHFPTDVLAGAIMGSGICVLLINYLF